MSKVSKASEILGDGGPRELVDRAWRQISKDILPPIHSARRRVHQRVRSKPTASEGKTLYPTKNPGPNWISHNEDWKRVIHRSEHREALRKDRSISVLDEPQDLSDRISWDGQDSLSVDVPANKADRWVWLGLNPDEYSWRNFRWEFDVTRESDFRELQFGFRYNGFYNRHRFQHEYGKLRYEKVRNGAFHKYFQTEPFEMELGEEYHFVIEAIGNWFTFEVDGETIIKEIDFAEDFPRGSCAIILWDKGNEIPIQAQIHNMKVTELIT